MCILIYLVFFMWIKIIIITLNNLIKLSNSFILFFYELFHTLNCIKVMAEYE